MKPAYLLAGGRSQRFGSNKARVMFRGKPLVHTLADDLDRLGWQVAIVAQSAEDYADLGLRVIPDISPDAGPMAGLLAALEDCRSQGAEYCLVSNCDLVPCNSAWPSSWDWLREMEQHWSKVSADVIAFQSDDFLPLPALYASGLYEHARKLWNEGARSLRDLHCFMHESIAKVTWPVERMPRTFNTHEELRNILDGRSDSEKLT